MSEEPGAPGRGLLAWWHRLPLYGRILGAMLLGVVVGVLWGPGAQHLRLPSDLILRLLRAVAPPLILVAVVHALAHADLRGRVGLRLLWLLASNTAVAIFIGILVANTLRPGLLAHLQRPENAAPIKPLDPAADLIEKIPTSLLRPLVDNNVISVILIALVFGLAFRHVRRRQADAGSEAFRPVEQLIETVYACLMAVLGWIIDLIPLAVFGVVASIVGTKGFHDFVALGYFVLAVLMALFLQMVFYLARVRLSSWVRPLALLRGCSDALTTAFSTASSTATMPITYTCLREKVGLREESASLGSLVGANFNNDGTALYEAMAALFIAQATGNVLSLPRQVTVAVTSVMASVGAPGIPEAGLVTMALVFTAVGLDVSYIPLLLTVDWFLDRCRTMINVMGDMAVSSILDGRTREAAPADG